MLCSTGKRRRSVISHKKCCTGGGKRDVLRQWRVSSRLNKSLGRVCATHSGDPRKIGRWSPPQFNYYGHMEWWDSLQMVYKQRGYLVLACPFPCNIGQVVCALRLIS